MILILKIYSDIVPFFKSSNLHTQPWCFHIPFVLFKLRHPLPVEVFRQRNRKLGVGESAWRATAQAALNAGKLRTNVFFVGFNWVKVFDMVVFFHLQKLTLKDADTIEFPKYVTLYI